jgi:hypothetical protein
MTELRDPSPATFCVAIAFAALLAAPSHAQLNSLCEVAIDHEAMPARVSGSTLRGLDPGVPSASVTLTVVQPRLAEERLAAPLQGSEGGALEVSRVINPSSTSTSLRFVLRGVENPAGLQGANLTCRFTGADGAAAESPLRWFELPYSGFAANCSTRSGPFENGPTLGVAVTDDATGEPAYRGDFQLGYPNSTTDRIGETINRVYQYALDGIC